MWKKLAGCAKVTYARLIYGWTKARQWLSGQGLWETIRDLSKKNRALVILALSAVLFSMAGYLMAGYPFFEALYASAALFFVNPVDETNNFPIMVGKFLSLVFAAGVILNVVSYAFRLAGHYRINRYPDSTAVYTDNPWGEALARGMKHGYIGAMAEHGGLESAKHHIFMYSDDAENLKLYTRHRQALQAAGAHAYIMLSRTDAFLLSGETDTRYEGPHFFNVYDMLAREYWREHSLYDAVAAAGERAIRVAVTDFGDLGQAICKYAVLNNVYRQDQAIEYHVWGAQSWQAAFLEGIDMMCGDRIVAHAGDCMDDIPLLASMDRVILAGSDNTALLQQLLYAATDAQLHCYAPGRTDLDALYAHAAGELVGFGDIDRILTEQSVKRELVYRNAKLLNYDYVLRERSKTEPRLKTELPEDFEQEMEDAWRRLSGFHKGSNIARADHLEIEARLIAEGLDAAVIGDIEHIRWCRFHFYNHWTYAPVRDNAHRKHHLLVREIEQGEMSKDSVFNDRIRRMLGL